MFHVEHRRGAREVTVTTEIEPEPSVAALLFGDRIELARSFTDRLGRDGEMLGLIGPLEPPRLWTRHVLNSVAVAPLLRPGMVGDVGSGAGLPGLVLAIARPDIRFALIEPMERRVDWLRGESDRLGLPNVDVIHARAEESGLDNRLDQVTARAVASLRKLIPVAAPLLRRGGELVFLKGERVRDEVAAAEKALRRARARDIEVLELGVGILPETTWAFRATVD